MRRRITLIVLMLIAGAIVNVAVAWGGHAICNSTTRQLIVKAYAPIEGYAADQIVNEQLFWTSFDYLPQILNSKINGDWPQLRLIEQGWPCRCLSCNGVWRGADFEWSTALGFTGFDESGNARDIPFADVVIWPGFAINTIFYAAIVWLLFFTPGAVRRTIRRRRGLCPACAYPIGTSPVCTECGNGVLQ